VTAAGTQRGEKRKEEKRRGEERSSAGAQRRLLLLEPMAARGRMSGRGPPAKRSGRDELSKTAKGSGNNSLLWAPGRGWDPGRRRGPGRD